MLAEISQIDFAAKVKYHGGCWAKYQTKVKSIFQRKSAKHQMMHVLHVAKVIMNGIKKREIVSEAIDALCDFIEFKLP